MSSSSNNYALNLRKFNMGKIKKDSVIVMIGKRNTGKSFLTKDMLYFHQDIPSGVVISATEQVNKFYSEFVPPIFIHDEFDEQIVDCVMKRQIKQIETKKKEEKMNGGFSNRNIKSFVIFDDCLYDDSWSKSKLVRALFMNGRHYKIMFILTMQYALGVPPSLRTNIDYVFILRENILNNRKKIWEHYAGIFPNFPMFCSIMDQCTNNYECLVIDNTVQSNRLEDCVFWYKADNRPDYRLCSRRCWEYSKNHYNTKSKDNEKKYDKNTFQSKSRNKPIINVRKYGEFSN